MDNLRTDMKNFTVGKIRRSLQRFLDFAGDLSRADMNTFDDRLSLLMNYCQNDEIFQVIDRQLTDIKSVDFDAWYAEKKPTMGGMEGSGELTFPTNLDERLSLMYQLLRRIKSGDLKFLDFSTTFFITGDNSIDSYHYAFNDAIVEPLMRELGYRFEDIEESLPENQRVSVPLAQVQIIHKANTVIQQSASGSDINQTAKISYGSEVQRLFNELKQEIRDKVLDESKRSDVLEIVESAEVLTQAEEPKQSSIKALLGALPPLGNIGSITSAILSTISAMG